MPHFPSFFVGSLVSGTAFLCLHEQLSYRGRLSNKWQLRESAEEVVMRGLKELNKSRNGATKGPKEQQQFVPNATYFSKSWNKVIEYVQDAARKD